jgi:hypothetical protein
MGLCGCRLVLVVAAVAFASATWAIESATPKKSSRLRFKDGPVCMCVNGLSEAQIQAAAKARQAGKGLPPIAPVAPTDKAHDQQKAGGR